MVLRDLDPLNLDPLEIGTHLPRVRNRGKNLVSLTELWIQTHFTEHADNSVVITKIPQVLLYVRNENQASHSNHAELRKLQ